MKSLLLVRHAKSSWEFNLEDFDRPLNHRGESDAPAMAKRLVKKDIKIDTFISSPAQRALTTAQLFAEVYDRKKKSIVIVPALYEAGISDFLSVIAGLDRDMKNVALFSHNPGITAFANTLTSTVIDDMPTCAVFAIKVDTKSWADFNEAPKEFWFFDYPKAN